MPNPSKTYPHIDQNKWLRVRQAAANYGIRIDRDQGNGNGWGIELGWNYESGNQALTIEITSSSFLISADSALTFVDALIRMA